MESSSSVASAAVRRSLIRANRVATFGPAHDERGGTECMSSTPMSRLKRATVWLLAQRDYRYRRHPAGARREGSPDCPAGPAS